MAPSISNIFDGAAATPLFERRGFMLDISRNRVPTMEWLKQLIDALALLRYNELQLYTEHTFAYADHSAVWEHGSPMTPQEIREIDAYCSDHGIELVPNQNSFAHLERWLRHPPYKHLAECPNGFEHPIAGWRTFGGTLAPTEQSAAFIDTLYAELLPNFTSKVLHIGCDEPWELGQGHSKERVDREGKHLLYLEFLNRLFALVEKHEHRAQFWADIVMERPDLVPQLPKNVTPVIWGYETNSPYAEQCRIAAEAGFKNNFYVAPGAGNWNSFSGRLDVARRNIELAAKEGNAHGALGLLLTAWGDNGHHQPWPTLFPALIMAAQATWSCPIDTNALPDQIDQLFYPDSPTGQGAVICELGRIDTMLSQPAPPSSFLHSAFFTDAEKFENTLSKLVTLDELQAVNAALQAIQFTGSDPEIGLSLELNRRAIQRCLRAKQGQPINSSDSAASYEALLKQFEQLWTMRSRTGGRNESLQLMRAMES
ncbi:MULTISPECIES: beta-N-acetylhexosaminidase [unclassified Lentimonas]|uniref:beta-N-acetylhexosaminidase n=1 Tax=unclassified Lentimonas TaxID=2630993 RepID=UPI00132286C6|nr:MULTISPECIES: beta-N-acetylhexosaminidase [unclassified Lentimonas]CAA6676577.1 Beta-hexosaminidase (EC [Lentimonas sp. CC4]CAA6684759.1 Beta-hexosaminidase (EC [Lentimonas sp. CC6]CAA7075395.1 Beta-hexosaminidase (EC [Lentimonas sp. CC4]CAA7168942.1 Beta-hexosaminidase (EC [Lentimonas sp. CC21]CAA7182196.1 Beta-hexosaminidase (EC [Lentimonas sp. CC8]